MEAEKKNFWHGVKGFFNEKFNLEADQAQQHEVIDNIARGVEFKGTNLWVLIFATMIASLGLNVNSAAVIIGAMLISPLMGPIMGLGLSLGINDFELFKRSCRNFGLMIAVSIVTSTLYFALSPLSHAESELLARTTPTIYDVLIAFFGGLAGIVAQSRKDRTTTVIPGVAIATALMPPLCTAGYGLATGQFNYFIGAFYLFFINTVFIAFATLFIVSFLRYDKKEFIDKKREKRVRRYITLITVATIIPSLVIAYNIVQRSLFDTNVDRYVAAVFNFPNTQVVKCDHIYGKRGKPSRIEVLLMGDVVSEDAIENARAQLPFYNLINAELAVRQASGGGEIDLRGLQLDYAGLLDEKNRQISELRRQIAVAPVADTLAMGDLAREAGVVVDNVARVSISRVTEYDTAGKAREEVTVCYVTPKGTGKVDTEKLRQWVAVRTGSDRVKIFVEQPK